MNERVQQIVEKKLRQSNIENAVQEARWIVKYVPDVPQINEVVQRRINGEPLQYLLGEWEFYGYPFKVGKGVLIPRPETELLVDVVLEHRACSIVIDLCAGSGCVGIALAKETGGGLLAIEKSEKAYYYLEQNIALNNLEPKKHIRTACSDVLKCGHFKLNDEMTVVINPPYLSKEDILNLQKEVRHEPTMALFGGEDGLDFYRKFFEMWKNPLNGAGMFACEVGDSQAAAVCEMMKNIGLSPHIKKDYNGIDRVVYSVK